MPNYLYPESLADVAHALVERAGVRLEGETASAVARLLVDHFHKTDAHAVEIRRLPRAAPSWAQGKVLHHPLPAAQLEREVAIVVRFLAQASAALDEPALAASSSTLYGQLGALSAGLAHHDWDGLVQACSHLRPKLRAWKRNRRAVWRGERMQLGRGLAWRKIRSVQELWAAAKGTHWCLRKGGDLAQDYAAALLARATTFWVLEKDGLALVLLAYDEELQDIDQVRDRSNNPPFAHRASLRRIARRLGVDVESSCCGDIRALCFDPHLGRRSQAHWIGLVTHGGTAEAFRFKLWADGRRRAYLISIRAEGRKRAGSYLLLRDEGEGWRLSGCTPDGWPSNTASLMLKVLGLAAETDSRTHWETARRALRSCRRRLKLE